MKKFLMAWIIILAFSITACGGKDSKDVTTCKSLGNQSHADISHCVKHLRKMQKDLGNLKESDL